MMRLWRAIGILVIVVGLYAGYTTYRSQREVLSTGAQQLVADFRYEAAIAEMDRVIAFYPNDAELYVLRGNITLLIYEWDRVLTDYNMAISLDANYADAYFYRGVLYYTQGPRELALADFQHYIVLASTGEHAQTARQYVEYIQIELDTLNG